ncbi:MAG: hypothetical protein V1871_03380 [Planctomycetota bacterium]
MKRFIPDGILLRIPVFHYVPRADGIPLIGRIPKGIIVTGISLIMLCSLLAVFAGDSTQDLQRAIQQKNNKLITNAVDDLVAQNNIASYNILIGALESLGASPEVQVYMAILSGIGRFTNQDVISKITSYILNHKDANVGTDMLAVMKNNRTSSVLPMLRTILEKGYYRIQLEALRQLSVIYSNDSLEVLFGYLKTLKPGEKELIKNVIGILKNLTGVDRGNYPESWLQWWDENKNRNASDIIKPPNSETQYGNVGEYRDMTPVKTALTQDKVIVVRHENTGQCANRGCHQNYDKIEDILSALEIEHTVVAKSDFDNDSYSLDDKWAILYNCNHFRELCSCPTCVPGGSKSLRASQCTGCGKHEIHDTKLSDKTIEKIRRFVETGGYLFTEDWAIEEIIERAFKGTIVHTKYLPGETVPIYAAPGTTLHPYLKYVFELPPSNNPEPAPETKGKGSETRSVKPEETTYRVNVEWKIDEDSPDLKILKKDIVTALIVSPKLSSEKAQDGYVAVTWGFSNNKEKIVTTSGDGKTSPYSYASGGRVLHVVSHFGKQKSKLDEFALQNLLLNFLTELSERRPKGQPQKAK